MQWPDCDAKVSSSIGVFDSGVGGLTVLRAIKDQLPLENLVYVADSGHAPYGERTPDFIIDRCRVIGSFLYSQPVKALVMACNTASVLAIEKLRAEFDIPIVGIEPAIKPASSVTRSGVVGVLATSRTLQSVGVQKLCDLYGQNVEILLQPCPGLVECIENSSLTSNATRELLEGFVQPLVDAKADTIVLGCTHYPFVREVIQDIAGSDVTVIEPGAAVARQLSRRLNELQLNRESRPPVPKDKQVNHVGSVCDQQGAIRFYTTGEPEMASDVMSSLWGEAVRVEALTSATG